MAVQSSGGTGENVNVVTSSPTVTFLSCPVQTIAGSVLASQQLYSRAGAPGQGFTFDAFFAKQASLQAAATLDQLCLTAVLASPGPAITDNSASANHVAQLFGDVSMAAAQIVATAGAQIPASHVFMPPALSKWYQSQVDGQYRPIWLPSPAATLGRAGGRVGARDEGYTGYDVVGCQVFEEPSQTAGTILVGAPADALLVLTGELAVDVTPEAYASQMTVALVARQYVAIAVLYPSAFVVISGTQIPTAPTFA